MQPCNYFKLLVILMVRIYFVPLVMDKPSSQCTDMRGRKNFFIGKLMRHGPRVTRNGCIRLP